MSNNLLQYLNQYDFDHTIEETGQKIKIRPITTGQMKSLLSYENDENIDAVDNMLDELIKGCVVTESFDVGNLTTQDRFELLLNIRKKTKGALYTFNTKCPKCSSVTINSINLDELENKPFPKGLNKVVKLNDSLSVELDFIRRSYQKMAFEKISSLKGKTDRQKMADAAIILYAMSMKRFITPIGEVSDASLEEKVQLLEALDGSTYETISKWFSDNDYGTIFKYNIKCFNCGEEEKRDIPISSFFS